MSDTITVRSGGPLSGEIAVGGAKNSVLKLMAATLLARGRTTLRNVPRISDVGVMGQVLAPLGVTVTADPAAADVVHLSCGDEVGSTAPEEPCRAIRASIAVLGPLLARTGRATVHLPGGDDFGNRPIDLHVKGLEALGVHFRQQGSLLEAETEAAGLRGAHVTLSFPSVGATENIVMAATCAAGRTVLENAAREPEIVDLCRFLVAMGARIEGIGTDTLVVRGVTPQDLRPVEHVVVGDRVEAATYLAALAVAGGRLALRGVRADHMTMYLSKLRDMGVHVEAFDGGVRAEASDRLRSVDVCTLPYPGVATDYKPLVTAMLSVADGVGIVTENLFAGRFRYVEELVRMGADIRTDAHHAVVRGVERLRGAEVTAHDIRAGAALVVAGLRAEGDTVIEGARHLDRGYDDLVGKLRSVGASISRP